MMPRGALDQLIDWREPCHDCGAPLKGAGRFTLDTVDDFKVGFMVCPACSCMRTWSEVATVKRGWFGLGGIFP